MKKIFISLILAFALTLTACNTNDNPESSETQPSSASLTTTETHSVEIELTSEETQAPEEEPAKVFEHVSYAACPAYRHMVELQKLDEEGGGLSA